MRKSTKDTIGVWLLLLIVVTVSAIHAVLGVALITAWATIDLAWYAGVAEGKKRSSNQLKTKEGR
ncbi:hypothetical protein AL523_12950 [Enterococcus gallinarum]|uniref:hypothetical protein n=1 Tax=Enterococcus casseliflavus TaxID=37734 RepID=UPI00076B68BE|nr:hypothetical protein [Enterococcus casseliflavus]AMG50592.1 hypothetical protein AL523_12950 [Enterococcus gallinarum]GEB28472.1 hypothetical protein ECA02_15670 [Enterococcus casseliflavus]STP35137.1 Uncharacterised protein [Enterococcus casseliflavus]